MSKNAAAVLAVIGSTITVFLLAYGGGVFVAFDLNPAHWPNGLRAGVVLVAAVGAPIVSMIAFIAVQSGSEG